MPPSDFSADPAGIAYDIQAIPEYGRLLSTIEHLLSSIDLCFQHRKHFPGLILLYAAIDTMSWLQAPSTRKGVKTSYCRWTKMFMTTQGTLACTPLELYSARCAVIHTGGIDSYLTQKGQRYRCQVLTIDMNG